ncbi:MAG TPA: SDR family oxidoreductase [Flexivirga sp.]|uniref:SDR family oxidoreductase n=1 Tax=Flexivirga sp. TaxID=1962927 RepID=UPI002C1BA705|nr:SDR family oxidoreductase [Flexivirga sp.]HWC21545.1 SDR family oxidoreductase [Flexivirga sp.]
MTVETRPVVLITGATRGIGRAVVDALADDHDLLIGGRDEAAVRSVCGVLPHATPFVADLTDPDSVAAAIDSLDETMQLAGVVHSAGVLGSGAVADLGRDAWRHTLEVNVVAVADLTRSLLPKLRAGRGTVVVVNSGAGLRSNAQGSLYSASKFAVRAFADGLREEERDNGVRVSTVYPGRVATDMQRELRDFEGGEYDESDYLRPESVASAVRFALTAPPEASVEDLSIRPR